MNARAISRSIVLATVALSVAATTAAAAQKVLDINIVNDTVPVEDVFALPDEICGVSGPFGGELLTNHLRFTLWEDDHFVFQTSNSVRLTDATGTLIMRDRIAAHAVSGKTSLPFSSTANLVSHCTSRSSAPGKLYEFHITFTVGEDGNLKQVHGEMCDPGGYPFC